MLVRLFDCSDYERTLRRQRLLALGLLLLGLTGLTCSFLLVPKSTLPDFAQGFYLGASTGICIGSVALLIRVQYLLTHPAARKKARVHAQDERERTIVNRAFLFAGVFTFYLGAAALLVLVAVDRPAAAAVLFLLAAYFLAFLLAHTWLQRRL